MKMKYSKDYFKSSTKLLSYINNFDNSGELFGDAARNTIKLFSLDGKIINIKSFQIPNAVNKIAYRFLRKSKAQRSFEYAHFLRANNIGTPYPIAYAEEKKGALFLRSFYVSEHLESDLTYRTLVQEPDYPSGEEILQAFTRFTFELHEKGIEFLDHSPGNTLIQLNNGDYKFFLVDLNRMNFRNLDFDARMRNFSRLTPKKEMVAVMAKEYASLYSKPEEEVFRKMWRYTLEFQNRFQRKKALKKKLKFWKK